MGTRPRAPDAEERDAVPAQPPEEVRRQRLEAKLSSVFATSADGLLIVDRAGAIVEANAAATAMLGYTREELLLLSVEDLVPVDARRGHAAMRDKFHERPLARAMGSLNARLSAQRKDGTVVRVDISLSPLLSDDGPEIVVALRDVTQIVAIAEAKGRLEEELRQRHRLEALGTLAAGVAHDFNNMLTPIVIHADLLKETTDREDDDVARSLEAIATAARRARLLVGQILMFSRNQQAAEPVVTSVRPVVEEVAMLLRASLPSGILLTVAPDGASPNVLIDPTQLHQVVLNLATNSMQAIGDPPGKVALSVDTVTLDSLAAGHLTLEARTYARIRVSDDGRGIDEAARSQIFDPFFTTKTRSKGSGLGLAVVHGIVATAAGAVTVESAPGHGATFTVYLPSVDAPTSLAPEPFIPKARAGDRVLLVDDDDLVLYSAGSTLQHRGYIVTSFVSATDAIDAFRTTPDGFDVVVTDETMPELGGLDVAKAVAALRPALPIVLISGNGSATDAERLAANIRHVVPKPFTTNELVEGLEAALSGR